MPRNRIKVEACWGGGERHYFRLTMPGGYREFVTGYRWTRRQAKNALDLAEHVYHMDRPRVRFVHA